MKEKDSIFKKINAILNPFKKLDDFSKKAEKDEIITTGQAIFNNFISNRLAVIGLVCFSILVSTVLIGAAVKPVDFYETELELINTAPGKKILNFPKELNGNDLVKIESGTTFSFALDKKGKLYSWGVNNPKNILGIPEKVQNNKVEDVVAGDAFVIVKLENGEYVGWGENMANQAELPTTVQPMLSGNYGHLFAGKNFAGVVTAGGKAYLWGDQSLGQDIVKKDWQGQIKKAVAGKFNAFYLLKDGTVGISGSGYVVTSTPKELQDGSVKVVDIAINKNNAIAIDDKGKVYTWGNGGNQLLLSENPAFDKKIVQVQAGYNAFALLTEDGEIITLGKNVYGEMESPKSQAKFTKIMGNYFQFYAVDETGKIHAWGLKGFLLGSDELGRDMLTRLFHGGKISLFIGVIAVLIASFIGILTGLISGFVGGWVDMFIQRLGEIISSIPFLPLVMTLSFAIGNKLSVVQRMYLVMVLIGLLSWVGLCRLIRGQILIEREKDFVLAARALGLKETTIIIRHILPSVLNIAIVSITLSYAGTMLTESALSFLGFGVQSPIPSWGNMLTNAQQASVVDLYWWRWIFPAAMIVIAVLSINLVGDGLRDAMDPKANEK